MLWAYCGMLPPPILISEVLPPVYIVYIAVVDGFYQRMWVDTIIWWHDECSVGVGVRGVSVATFSISVQAQMSTPIYGFHGLFTRGSLDRMADNIGLVDPINHLPGVCTVFYPYTTIILIDHHHQKLQKFRVH